MQNSKTTVTPSAQDQRGSLDVDAGSVIERNPAYDGPDGIFSRCGEYDTPNQRLEDACTLGNLTMFERALSDGADPRANRDRAAWLAREHGHESLYKELVARGCGPSAHI